MLLILGEVRGFGMMFRLMNDNKFLPAWLSNILISSAEARKSSSMHLACLTFFWEKHRWAFFRSLVKNCRDWEVEEEKPNFRSYVREWRPTVAYHIDLDFWIKLSAANEALYIFLSFWSKGSFLQGYGDGRATFRRRDRTNHGWLFCVFLVPNMKLSDLLLWKWRDSVSCREIFEDDDRRDLYSAIPWRVADPAYLAQPAFLERWPESFKHRSISGYIVPTRLWENAVILAAF